MKKYILPLIFIPLFNILYATKIHKITAETNSVPEQAVKKYFTLKEGDLFTLQKYEQAKRNLENTKLFKSLDVLYKEGKDGIDIHIKAEGRTYILPVLFGLSADKHSVGASLTIKNLVKKGESFYTSFGYGKDGFSTNNTLEFGKNSFDIDYSHLDFTQHFYKNGWYSRKGVFTVADKKKKHNNFLLNKIHGLQDNFLISYTYQISSVWSAFIKPEYEYYLYQNRALDSGNHSRLNFGLRYGDHFNAGMSLRGLNKIGHIEKKDILKNLSYLQQGKLVEVSYTAGGKWSSSDYNISKLAVEGSYIWEFKKHNTIALFSKIQKAFCAPFSNLIGSSDLLFDIGIYDREQRGKEGISAGLEITFFLLRNETGIIFLAPFYEQVFISSGVNSYDSYSGIGATLALRLWNIPLPMSTSFTHNLSDSSQHLGFKIEGHF